MGSMVNLCSAMLCYCEHLSDLRSKVEELEKTAALCKDEADKANGRAEMLQRQCHDALLKQVGSLNPSTTEILSPVSINEPATGDQEKLSDVLERIYQDLKSALEKAQDTEALTKFRSRMAQLVLGGTTSGEEDNCLRTISPLELCGSGTESELCDRSPLLSRKRRSTDGGGSGSFRSSSSDDGDLKRTTAVERKTKNGEEATGIISPPTNVRLAADLRNGRYLVCWSPPETIGGIQGYKVYVKDAMRKYVTNVHSTKAVIECGLENDWMFINVRAVAGAAESISVSIDVERSKKFVQNTMLNDTGATTVDERRKLPSHDDNEDDEECSEV